MSSDFEEQMVSAFNAMVDAPPTTEEAKKACFIKTKIFGRSAANGDDVVLSQFHQCLAIVRIRNVWIAFTDNVLSAEEALGVVWGSALEILKANGVEKYPYDLPDNHHPLAQDALKLLIEIKEIVRLASVAGKKDSLMLRHGARLDRLISFMEERWYLDDVKRGHKSIVSASLGHQEVHGTSKQKRKRWDEMKERWDQLYEEEKRKFPNKKPGVQAIDRQVAKEFGVTDRTVREVRLEKKVK